MALFDENNEERTESATVYRREEFRRQGSVAISREILSIVVILAVGLTVYFSAHSMSQEFGVLSDRFFKFGALDDMGREGFLEMRQDALKSFSVMILPVFIAAVLAGIVACVAQVGFFVTWEPLTPKWERLDPTQGLQRIFSSNGVVEAAKALVKLAIGGIVIWVFLKARAGEAGIYFHKTVPEFSTILASHALKLGTTLLVYLVVIAVIDYAFQRYRLEQQMKMTRREAKEEFKMREGDPLIKSRIKSIQRKIASRRMMENVPKAAVVITNPTHLAIALQYEANMGAPRVVAKGAGFIAQKIRELAKEHGIPIVENKPLARSIFKTVNIGQLIPPDLYKAVAQVLAYVFRLKGTRGFASAGAASGG